MSLESLTRFSAGSMNDHLNKHLWVKGAELFIPQLNSLLKHNNYTPKIISIDYFLNNDVDKLADILNKNQSDKATPLVHNYHIAYTYIINKLGRESKLNFLEIGLGTNNPDLVSSMGQWGRPGASLYSFQEYLPNSKIFGCDIDKNILFDKDRIKTCYVDQLDIESFKGITQKFGSRLYDIIIDDGLHSIGANFNTLLFALDNVNDDGWIIIEDIQKEKMDNWYAIDYILSKNKNYETFMVSCTGGGWLYILHKL